MKHFNMLKEKTLRFAVNTICIPIIIPLAILRYGFNIHLWRMRECRIGHLALNTDLFLRNLKLEMIPNKRIKHVLTASNKVGNEQLLKMFKRKIRIIQIPQPKLVRAVTKIVAKYSILNRMKLYQELSSDETEYYNLKISKIEPRLSFTEIEKQKGKQLLHEMGVGDNWFICFHARDSSYLDKEWKKGDSYHQHRNCDISDFLKAAKYISQKGGFAIRVGSVVEKKLENIENFKIVDYATTHRTDFGDIYLNAKCKFFLGSDCGITQISQISNVPIVATNIVPLSKPPWSFRDLFIPKKYWLKEEKRYMAFKEMLDPKILSFINSNKFEKIGIEPHENTPQEILDVAIEMNERIDGTWEETEEDKELQRKFKSLFEPGFRSYSFTSKIGAKFLRENKYLLN